MKLSMRNIFSVLLFIAVMIPLFSGSKATIHYKNGSTLDCFVENYEIGKYAEVIDDKGNKRIISWDNISEVVFLKEEEVSVAVPDIVEEEPIIENEEIELEPVTDAELESAEPVAVPVAPFSENSGGKSMLEQFKSKDKKVEDSQTLKTEETRPKNAAERWAERNNQEVKPSQTSRVVTEEIPDVDYDRKSGKVSVEYYKTLESDSKRRSWIENGGILKGSGFTGNYTYTSMEFDNYDGSTTDFTMNGFGFTYSGTMKFIQPPNYDEGKNMWGGFSIGFMGSFNGTFGSMDMPMIGFDWNTMTQYTYMAEMNMTMLTYEFSGNIGYTFGLGRFFTPEEWKGVMLGLYWKPNFVMSKVTTEIEGEYYEGDPTSSFNPTGFQWTLDWGSFGALANTLAKEAHLSINGFILPETDETPFVFSVGLGVVWY
ncbi:MAG: hypothetical protein JXN63_06950 [Candidatus Delongbacteria bacterium]|nr:hypothetical protein [Candidatus Delongbacteria bacterium]